MTIPWPVDEARDAWESEQAARANRMQLCHVCGAPHDSGAAGYIVRARRRPALLFWPDARCERCAPERFRPRC